MSTFNTANLDDKTLYHLYDENEFSDDKGRTLSSTQRSHSKHPWLAHLPLAKHLSQRVQADVEPDALPSTTAWSAFAERLQLMKMQAQLMSELLDDCRRGSYRDVSWYALAACTAAISYAVNPHDQRPNRLASGLFDDIALTWLATRIAGSELKTYCAFKGYDVHAYFPAN